MDYTFSSDQAVLLRGRGLASQLRHLCPTPKCLGSTPASSPCPTLWRTPGSLSLSPPFPTWLSHHSAGASERALGLGPSAQFRFCSCETDRQMHQACGLSSLLLHEDCTPRLVHLYSCPFWGYAQTLSSTSTTELAACWGHLGARGLFFHSCAESLSCLANLHF